MYIHYFTGKPLVLKVNSTQKNGGCFFDRSSQISNNSKPEEKVPLEKTSTERIEMLH
jgi:hypothetical protein